MYIIQDWAGNRMFPRKTFESFEDGWDFIYENIPEEKEWDGTYDDIFIVQV